MTSSWDVSDVKRENCRNHVHSFVFPVNWATTCNSNQNTSSRCNLPSVLESQKQELAYCSPAPFFCIMTQVTKISNIEFHNNFYYRCIWMVCQGLGRVAKPHLSRPTSKFGLSWRCRHYFQAEHHMLFPIFFCILRIRRIPGEIGHRNELGHLQFLRHCCLKGCFGGASAWLILFIVAQ